MSSHLFATGLSLPQRTLLRSGAARVLGALKIDRSKPSGGGYLNDVLEFGGIVRSYTDAPDIELLVKQMGRLPSIGVALATRRFETINTARTQFKSEIQLLLYFSTSHGRDMEIGRHQMDVTALRDPHADPGLDVMMEHALELLAGQFVADTPTVKQCIPVVEQELVTFPNITIWTQTYDVQLDTLTLGKNKEFRTADQLLTAWQARVTTDPTDPRPPTPAGSSAAVDTTNPK